MSSDLYLDKSARPPGPATGPFRILCLSGGGYRGLYTAAILEELEKQAQKPLAEIFDLIAGTSIGGILALGLAAGIPAETLRLSFEENGETIFPRYFRVRGHSVFPRLSRGVLRSRYNVEGLRSTIQKILGNAADIRLLQDITKTRVLIAGVNVTQSQPVLFGIDNGSLSASLVDVALATSAAPTYFPEHRIGTDNFVDGGLVANAPDAIAAMYALQGRTREEIQMLSIGTVGGAGGEAARKPSRTGWLIRGKKLVDLTLTSQERMSINVTRNLLGLNYIRLDAPPSTDQMKAIGLDRTGQTASDTLKALAQKTCAEGFRTYQASLRAMLR